jgi:RNA polymerase sigma factor (sigma-70 family)
MHAGDGLVGVVRHLRRQCGDAPGDGELLARFAAERDESAFAALVRRHGGLVLGVARRQLADRQQAEDVFQATFLDLARQAPRLGRPASLINWLYTVALRQARKTRLAASRRAARTARLALPPAVADPLAEVSGRELVAVIDEELAGLPEAYRLPLLLCGLHGLSREEAARRLGWTAGAVKGRLERGRDLLRRRLEARGLTVPAVFAGVLAADSTTAAPPALVAATSRAALAALAAPMAWGSLKALSVGVVLLVVGVGALVAPASRERQRPESAKQKALVAGAPGSPGNPQPAAPAPRVDREGVPLPPGALMRIGSSRMRHAGFVYTVAFAPDGKSLASGSVDGVRVWETATGKLLRHFPDPAQYSQALGFTADGRELVFVTGTDRALKAPGTVRRFDPTTGRELFRAELSGDDPAHDVFLSRSGKRMAIARTVGKPAVVHVHDTGTGKETLRIQCENWRVRGVDFTPDDRTMAVADVRDTLALYDTATGRLTGELKHEGVRFIFARFSPDGRTLATLAGDDREPYVAELWDVAEWKVRLRLPLPETDAYSTHDLSFSPDGKLVATSSQRPNVILWDAATGREVRRYRGHPTVMRTAFSPDGPTLAAASNNGTVQLWDVAGGRLLPASADPIVCVLHLRFGRDGRSLIGYADRLMAWDLATGQEVSRFPRVGPSSDWELLSPDERMIASFQSVDGTIRLSDAANGQEVRTLRGEKPLIWAGTVSFTPDGRRLIASDQQHAILVFDVASGRAVQTLPSRGGWVNPLVISPDGHWLAEASRYARRGQDRTIRLWDLTANREVRRLTPHPDAVLALAFSPDGRRPASASSGSRGEEPGPIQLWDVESGRELWSAKGNGSYYFAAFAPDGRTLATSGDGGAIRLLEVATGRERHRITGHAGGVYSAAFTPDGQTLAASSSEAPVYIWDVFGLAERPKQPKQPPTTAELQQSWAELAGDDAKAAFQAIRMFVAAPDRAVAFLRERLKLVPAVDAVQVREVVRRLNSPRFAERQQAAQELERLADRAVPILRAALKDAASAEVRQTLQRLLDKLAAGTPEALRAIRAAEVLEHVGTQAARQHLRALAGGAPGATLTTAAAAALQRLEAR